LCRDEDEARGKEWGMNEESGKRGMGDVEVEG
jgi:hypothetical protein